MNDPLLTLGVIGTCHKADEKRAPVEPSHIADIPAELRERIYFQAGYGGRFGVADADLGRVLSTEAIYEQCDIVLLAKPTPPDFPSFREGQIIWGWPHCVQGEAITQTAIDKKLTLIAWEAMNLWQGDQRGLHVFHQNNELAGYCAVLHAMELAGRSGRYGPPLRAAVIEFGLTARGSIHGLQGLGVTDITCFTRRAAPDLPAPIGGVRYRRFEDAGGGETRALDPARPMAEELAEYDIVINCIFQDTDHPLFFARTPDLARFRPGAWILDVSCDEKLGFDFARPTSFQSPIFDAGHGVTYYGVDHTPSYLWRASTHEISRALLPYLPTVMAGPEAWEQNEVIRRAIEIRDGRILNPLILSRQNRDPEYPHAKR